ncbi:hypothetical protein [Nocardia sp. NPDC059691]|uniref:hypothetical protein n=1 Tax=Nocardia sp. NPDC059691 TaxID=3346908 RepID=UPI0036AF8EE0
MSQLSTLSVPEIATERRDGLATAVTLAGALALLPGAGAQGRWNELGGGEFLARLERS